MYLYVYVYVLYFGLWIVFKDIRYFLASDPPTYPWWRRTGPSPRPPASSSTSLIPSPTPSTSRKCTLRIPSPQTGVSGKALSSYMWILILFSSDDFFFFIHNQFLCLSFRYSPKSFSSFFFLLIRSLYYCLKAFSFSLHFRFSPLIFAFICFFYLTLVYSLMSFFFLCLICSYFNIFIFSSF